MPDTPQEVYPMSDTTTKAPPTSDSSTEVTRDQLVEGLQEDLAREYKAIIQYIIFSQKLDDAKYMTIADELATHAHEELDHALAIANQLDYFGVYPDHAPAPVWVSEKNEDMLWYDLYAEDDTVKAYRERIRQAQALGEYALAEVLQELVRQEQDHQIDLATALGVIADPNQREGKGPGRPKKV
jgi:bacterioferritin